MARIIEKSEAAATVSYEHKYILVYNMRGLRSWSCVSVYVKTLAKWLDAALASLSLTFTLILMYN